VNRYTFLGKETQISTGYVDIQARFYDPTIGRFLSVDPMGHKYLDNSPYNYVSNRPTIAVDPDGKEIKIYYSKF
jgi:RHS repeat-associated protein